MNTKAANAFNLLAAQHKVELTPIVLNKTPELRMVTEESLAETQTLVNLRILVAEETQAIEDSMAKTQTMAVKEPAIAEPSVYEDAFTHETELAVNEGIVAYTQQITAPLYQIHTGEARVKAAVPSATELRDLLIKYLGEEYGGTLAVVEEKTHKLFHSLRGIMIDYNCEQRARRRWFAAGYGRDSYARVQPVAMMLLENARCRWSS